jgi:hypothetical protein
MVFTFYNNKKICYFASNLLCVPVKIVVDNHNCLEEPRLLFTLLWIHMFLGLPEIRHYFVRIWILPLTNKTGKKP